MSPRRAHRYALPRPRTLRPTLRPPSLRLAEHRPRPGESRDARRADQSIVVVASIALVGALAFVIWVAYEALLLVFASILLAVLLRGLSDPLSRYTGMREGYALAIVLALLGTALALGGVFLGAELASQLDQLVPRLHENWEQVQRWLYRFGRSVANAKLEQLTPEKADWIARITSGIFSNVAGALAALVIAIFIGLYGAAAPQTYREGLLSLMPPGKRQRAGEVIDAAGETLRSWLVGTLLKMTVVGIATTFGLMVLGIPLALALGLLAFLFGFIPYLGPFLAAIPALLVGLTAGTMEAAYVGLLYLAIQTMEGYVLSPLVDQRSVHLPPALALASQVLLGVVLGPLGVVLAIPLIALAMVLIKMLYIEDVLGEQPPA
jgi:predicted PurR-regulated permease PerM